MFIAHGRRYVYRSRLTLQNHIFDDFYLWRKRLKLELSRNCISISFTLDMQTSLNQKPIFAIIGRQYTTDFEEREEVLEFVEVRGSHVGEDLAKVVEKLCTELSIRDKLFAITGDNAGNNGTLCQSLYTSLKHQYDDKFSLISKPRIYFHGRPSWIRYLAHVIALIASDVLNDLKARSTKEAKKVLDSWDAEAKGAQYNVPDDGGRSAIAKVRLLNLWILYSSQ